MSGISLDDLVGRSVYILREAKSRFRNPVCMWSSGKDSTTMINLCRDAFYGTVPFPVLHINTGYKFPEIYSFMDDLAKEWGLDLIRVSHPLAGKLDPKTGRENCCSLLKTETLKQVIHDRGFDAVIVAIRRDEHGIRNRERYMSPRDKEMRWKVWTEKGGEYGTSLQDVEMSGWGLFETDFGPDADHVRVHPMLHWCELDVWEYIKKYDVPINPLYRASYVKEKYGLEGKRYRSLGCMPCTSPIESTASTIDEIVEELRRTDVPERSGRAQDKESPHTMQKLRALGYF